MNQELGGDGTVLGCGGRYTLAVGMSKKQAITCWFLWEGYLKPIRHLIQGWEDHPIYSQMGSSAYPHRQGQNVPNSPKQLETVGLFAFDPTY